MGIEYIHLFGDTTDSTFTFGAGFHNVGHGVLRASDETTIE